MTSYPMLEGASTLTSQPPLLAVGTSTPPEINYKETLADYKFNQIASYSAWKWNIELAAYLASLFVMEANHHHVMNWKIEIHDSPS